MIIRETSASGGNRSGTSLLGAVIRGGIMAALVCGASGPVRADPVRVVTSGGLFQLPVENETEVSLRGNGFSIVGGEVPILTVDACPCLPGESSSLSTDFSTITRPPWTVTIDGQTFDEVFLSGTLFFHAGSVTVPNVALGGPGVFPTTSFTMTASLDGFADRGLTRPLFSETFIGSGTASVGFFNLVGGSGITRDGLQFEFTDAAATPEPATLLLVAPGAAWIVRRRRRGR
jgi:hypothetical protein